MGPISARDGNGSPLPALLAGLLAVAIFVVDTLTPLDSAVAVLYGAVILLVADRLGQRGLLMAGLGCTGLTLTSFALVHGATLDPEAILRGGVSVTAILVTTLLSLRTRRARQSLADQAALLDLTHDAILVRDEADTILYWNRGAEALYGWPAGKAVGQNAGALLGTRFPVSRAAAMDALHREARWEGELRQIRADGARIIVSSRWSLQRDAGGRPVAAMETNRDITERTRAEQQLQKARRDLAHVTRMATFGQLTASIAHEVSQPLAAVITNGEACLRWLARPVPDIPEATASVERMIASSRRAGSVVARMRALSRRETPRHEPLDLNGVIREAAGLIAGELAGRGVTPVLVLAPDLPVVGGDRIQLQQMFINLMMNAAQAMDGQTGPRLLTLRTAAGCTGSGVPQVDITVHDTGAGVPPDLRPRLFEPFYSSRPNGMGLGLSICATIIEAHLGHIEALPNPDRGMTFRVRLPVLKDETP